jgi:membrane-associated protein
MEVIAQLVDLLLHLDQYLTVFLQQHGAWVYVLLFMIVFAETGLVVTPFLPGDSLLFVAGALAAAGGMDVGFLCLLLTTAAVTGDNVNYWFGRYVGPRVFSREDSAVFNRRHLDMTRAFYDRHGGKTVVIARFLPIVRTFAPFVAGVGHMPYGRFLAFSVGGGIFWVTSLTLLGYFFGNLPFVKQNLSIAILVIILLSITPGIIAFLRHRRRA